MRRQLWNRELHRYDCLMLCRAECDFESIQVDDSVVNPPLTVLPFNRHAFDTAHHW